MISIGKKRKQDVQGGSFGILEEGARYNFPKAGGGWNWPS
jgi:hypothetical protein